MIDGLQGRLSALVRDHGVAGIGLAVLADGVVHEAAAGVADIRTGVPMTSRHLCFIGSTTKVFTATLIMQLVDEGLLDLDEPVIRYLPKLNLPGDLTTAHLISHTSGLSNGPYADHGRGDDAVQRYVSQLGPANVVCPTGQRWGYSNAAFVIAGRLVETLRNSDWDTALRRHLLVPAGMCESATLPEEILVRLVAMPHLRANQGLSVAPQWGLSGRAMGPTGSTMVMTAADLLRFAAVHLGKGQNANGERILSSSSVEVMMQPRTQVAAGSPFAEQWALGWYTGQWGAMRHVGHSGHNLGGGSHLILFPDAGGALAVVFNSVPGEAGLVHELFADLGRELFGASKPPPWHPITPLTSEQVAGYAGTYSCNEFTLDVKAFGKDLEITTLGPGLGAPARRMSPALNGAAWGTGTLGAHAAAAPEGFLTPEVFFSGHDQSGRPEFAHASVFLARRTD